MEPIILLVVDDEQGMRQGINRALRKYTIEVPDSDETAEFSLENAGSAEEALEILEKSEDNPPHIILLDNKLPGMSGVDLLDTISKRNIDSLVIMISAYASIETAVRATKSGAFDFIPKPFTPDELKNTVKKAAQHKIAQLQAQKLAQEKRQVRFQFISVLAHELKAPLNAVEGYLKIIHDRSAGDDQATYDHMIERCLTRMEYMRKMIFDLLDLTRIESGQKKREITEFDLIDPVNQAVETSKPMAEEKQVTINLHAPESHQFAGDPGEIEIIMNNLISNAVKYNRDEGRVDVTVTPDTDSVTIKVEDTGIGMSEEEKEKLFGDFVRIKNKKTKNVLGSGLGLSIVKKLVNLYKGDIEVESTPDIGSTFTVTLYKVESDKTD